MEHLQSTVVMESYCNLNLGAPMDQPTQQIDPFTAAIIEQRNGALNEAAFWRAEAMKAQSLLAAAKPPKAKKPVGAPSGS